MILGMKSATNGLARGKGKSQRISYGDGLIRLDRPGGANSWVCRVQKHGNRRDFGLGSCKKVSLAREYVVPLSRRPLRIVQRCGRLRIAGCELVFPGIRRNQRLCDMTLSKLVKELGELLPRTDSVHHSAIGSAKKPTIRAVSPKPPSPTRSRIRPRPLTGAAICSKSAA